MLDRLAIATFALLAGCNQIYDLDPTRLREPEAGDTGMDIDLDGIADDGDPCLAPMRDAEDDLDGDGIAAASDPCPFDPASSGDRDGDGLHDACDPFPDTLGDRQRCYMSFGSTDLNARLWRSRDATPSWTSREGELYTIGLPALAGVVATIDLAPPGQTTLDTLVTLSNASTGIYGFRVWGRAADTFDNRELGCELSGDPMSIRVAIVRGNDMDVPGGSTNGFLAFPRSMPVRVRLTIGPAGTGMDVRCEVSWSSVVATVKAHVDEVPPGRVAFGVENLSGQISALAIYERDTPLPFP